MTIRSSISRTPEIMHSVPAALFENQTPVQLTRQACMPSACNLLAVIMQASMHVLHSYYVQAELHVGSSTLRAISSLEGCLKNLMSLTLPSVLNVYMNMLKHLLGAVSLSSSLVKTPSFGSACSSHITIAGRLLHLIKAGICIHCSMPQLFREQHM